MSAVIDKISKARERYYSPSREECITVGLDDFEDDEIKKEFAHRFGNDTAAEVEALKLDDEDEPVTISGVRLREITYMQRLGRHAEAARAIDDLIRDTLGTAI